jgi:hypothetical protein
LTGSGSGSKASGKDNGDTEKKQQGSGARMLHVPVIPTICSRAVFPAAIHQKDKIIHKMILKTHPT